MDQRSKVGYNHIYVSLILCVCIYVFVNIFFKIKLNHLSASTMG